MPFRRSRKGPLSKPPAILPPGPPPDGLPFPASEIALSDEAERTRLLSLRLSLEQKSWIKQATAWYALPITAQKEAHAWLLAEQKRASDREKRVAKKAAVLALREQARRARKPVDKATLPPRVVTAHEAAPDGTLLLRLRLGGRPATKKTSNQLKQGKILPSERFLTWQAQCENACKEAWVRRGEVPMDFGVAVRMRVTIQDWTFGDCTGYQQAVGDVLQEWGVIADDQWLHWIADLNAHYIAGMDKDNPGCEIEIYRLRHPYESKRNANDATFARRRTRLQAAGWRERGDGFLVSPAGEVAPPPPLRRWEIESEVPR